MIYLTKKMFFSASHRVYNPTWSDAKNEEIFGQCSNINGHGHNYELEVVVCGEINEETGYVMDLKKLKQIIKDIIISRVDHKNLNTDVPFLKNIIPTSENITKAFWNLLQEKLTNVKLYKIKLSESSTSSIEYYGE